jgi:hypothetical protein
MNRHGLARRLAGSASALLLALSLGACGGHHSNVTTKSAGSNVAGVAGGTVLVAAGTDFYGKLQQPIGTKTSHDGDTFALAQTDTLFHKDPALQGAIVDGHLEDVGSAGPMRNPKLTLVFDDIRMPDGTKAPIVVQLETLKAFEPKTHHLRTLGLMVGGAIAGHVIAKRAGKPLGALTGAAGGYALSQSLKTDISVPAGTLVILKFRAPVTAGSSTPGS